LFILFIIFLLSVPISINLFIGTVRRSQVTPQGKMLMGQVSFFYTKDIWQNLTYIYKLGTILLAFITMISITNEYSYKTVKQNIIDGLSKKEFLLSKIYMIFVLSITVTILVGVIGIVTGFLYSETNNLNLILENIEFLGFYFVYILNFLLFSLFIGVLVKKSGVSIAIIIFYIIMIEPIIVAITTYGLEIKWLSAFYPINGINNLITNPFAKYIVTDLNKLPVSPLVVAFVYIIIYIYGTYLLLKNRDL
jgi:ABC-type transport system involved in multi-copper enzyme maturation permease subunit